MKKKRGSHEPGDGATFRLPESGLAEDILKAFASSMAAEEAEEAEEDDGTAGGPAEAPAPAREPGRKPSSSAQGTDRVYAFVDRLERHAAREADEAREDPETWVTFDLSGEVYGLPVARIEEVLRVTAITRVPHAPTPVRGITNMRGRVLAVVDLRVRLGLPPAPIDAQSRILVVSSRERSIGLLADAARQVIKILPSSVQPPPTDVVTSRSDFIVGVVRAGETLVILLDIDRVLLIQEGTEMPEPEHEEAAL
ncbi:MAG TPA: chemotaxis protein CheW [Thermoanaerobaculia bacterium]|nr:chemotaxis protein CheW [Thermoanaerobaculia bacterium]